MSKRVLVSDSEDDREPSPMQQRPVPPQERVDAAVDVVQPVPPSKPFRANGRHLSITFAQAPEEWSRQGVLAHLSNRLAGVGEYVVAMERHADGGKHFHVYLGATPGKKFDIKNARLLDMGGQHPNISVCADFKAWIKYCKKEDQEFIESTGIACLVEEKKKWSDVFDAPDPEAAGRIVRTSWARDWLINGDKIQSNIESFFRARELGAAGTVRRGHALESFKSDGSAGLIRDWFAQYVTGRTAAMDRSPCLIIVGPTRVAKTSLVRAFDERHMYFRGHFALDGWDPLAKYMVFDDIPWKFIPNKKELLTNMDQEVWLTDRYRAKKSVRTNMPAVICWNKNYLIQDTEEDQEYWEANTLTIYVDERLY